MVKIIGVGSATITARQTGTIVIAAAEEEQTLIVNKSNQTIIFEAVPVKNIGDAPFTLPASSSSGETIEYSSVYGKVEITGNVVTPVSAGRETIIATLAANENYNDALPVEQSFCIKPSKPGITFQDTSNGAVLISSNAIGNQWYLNGNQIQDASSQTLTGLTTGIYSVNTTIDDCASELSDVYPLVVTSSEEVDLAHRISIFPNPASDKVVVTMSDLKEKQLSIGVLDPMGRTYDLVGELDDNNYITDVSGLPAGVYLIKVKHDQTIYYARFVKQ
jgi:hypothetical protein